MSTQPDTKPKEETAALNKANEVRASTTAAPSTAKDGV